jgi:hypothetical protein
VAADLPKLARDFAARIQRVLNATVCDGATISAAVSRDPRIVAVGHGLGKASLETKLVPVCVGRRKPQCWLDVSFRLCLDDPGQYLAVVASFFGIYATDTSRSCLCHFDYERGKDGYPEAHVQVYGDSAALVGWGGQSQPRQLDRLHLPVGGRRFRPALEDVIEFLIVEKLAEARKGWTDVLRDERCDYHRIQLRAAIRNDPETARQALKDFGFL